MEPPEMTAQAMVSQGLNPDDFFVLRHGETRRVGDNANSLDWGPHAGHSSIVRSCVIGARSHGYKTKY